MPVVVEVQQHYKVLFPEVEEQVVEVMVLTQRMYQPQELMV